VPAGAVGADAVVEEGRAAAVAKVELASGGVVAHALPRERAGRRDAALAVPAVVALAPAGRLQLARADVERDTRCAECARVRAARSALAGGGGRGARRGVAGAGGGCGAGAGGRLGAGAAGESLALQ